jgi:hypothetical protein
MIQSNIDIYFFLNKYDNRKYVELLAKIFVLTYKQDTPFELIIFTTSDIYDTKSHHGGIVCLFNMRIYLN